MKFGVVVFPGSNCDQDCFYVIKEILNQEVYYIWHNSDEDLSKFHCIVLPGGFSFGDYLRAGAIAKFSKIMDSIYKFANKGGLVIGICNGFQILLEVGLLEGAMLWNKTCHFICKHVYLRVENTNTPFTNLFKKGQVLKIPIAHNEGNYYIGRNELKKLNDNQQIVFRYCDREGNINSYSNPNGSLENIAGIINKNLNVLGLMPHPERASEKILGSKDGLFIFKSIINWLTK